MLGLQAEFGWFVELAQLFVSLTVQMLTDQPQSGFFSFSIIVLRRVIICLVLISCSTIKKKKRNSFMRWILSRFSGFSFKREKELRWEENVNFLHLSFFQIPTTKKQLLFISRATKKNRDFNVNKSSWILIDLFYY